MRLHYLDADQLVTDAQKLALAVLDAGYHPDLLLALWRGGAAVGIALHEALGYAGIACEHFPLRVSSYVGVDRRQQVSVYGLDALAPFLQRCHRVLLVDDVFDTGNSMRVLIELLQRMTAPAPPQIRMAMPWYKPARNQTALVPDFYLHTTDDWLVFPHELQDLDAGQLLAKPGDTATLRALLARRERPVKG